MALGQQETFIKQLDALTRFLETSGRPEDDFIFFDDARFAGTCSWLSNTKSFQDWVSDLPNRPITLLVSGRPATGKSVLASHVVDFLQERKLDVSYYFFRHGDKTKSRLSACLRSLAWQMCQSNEVLRQVLLKMQENGVRLSQENHRSLWRTLYASGIFNSLFTRHFWVIDALDECTAGNVLIETMLTSLPRSVPLSIFVTTREAPKDRDASSEMGEVRSQNIEIATTDTLPDMRTVVEAKARHLPFNGDRDRASLINNILQKSGGSFLWTTLVLDQLSQCHSGDDIHRTLEEMPEEMRPLYQRILQTMAQERVSRKLTEAILAWTACAIRPLSIQELEGALKADLNDTFPRLEDSVRTLCGNLVTIDKSQNVRMIHQTARDYVLRDKGYSELAIHEKDAHVRIARSCLSYLSGSEMRPPRTFHGGSNRNTTGRRSEFSRYASIAYSHHLAHSDPCSNELLVLLETFLGSNVLSWIEIIAQAQDLRPLVRASKDLKRYHDLCTVTRSPLGRSMHVVRGWATDFIRITAKFADALTLCPSLIYNLVSPFCPTGSMVNKTFPSSKRIAVSGMSNSEWEDRLSCLDFRENQASAVCYSDEILAVGLTVGTIKLYQASSCEELKSLEHGEAVRILASKPGSSILASCGVKMVRIWDTIQGITLHTFRTSHRFVSLAFDGDKLLAASSKNYLRTWDLTSGAKQLSDKFWKDSGTEHRRAPLAVPSAVTISIAHQMIAIAHNQRMVMLWDLEEDAYYGSCGKKTGSGETSKHMVTAMLFNPNPSISLLAISYLDGNIICLDPFTNQEAASLRANCHTLAASPDGRLLAGGAGGGVIQIYEFDTLRLLYRVRSFDLFIKQLIFSRDGLRFSDIRGSHCNTWEPVALLQEVRGDESSDGTLTSFVDVVEIESSIKIACIAFDPTHDAVFCGKDDGVVSLYRQGKRLLERKLFSHKSQVRFMIWWSDHDSLVTTDSSNMISMWKLINTPKHGWLTDRCSFSARVNNHSSITGILLGESVKKIVISTRKSDHLWGTNGEQQDVRVYAVELDRKWAQHPQSADSMICLEGMHVRVFAWNDWSEILTVSLDTTLYEWRPESLLFCQTGSQSKILVESAQPDSHLSGTILRLFDATPMMPDISTSKMSLQNEEEASGIHLPTLRSAISTSISDLQLDAIAQYISRIVGIDDRNCLIFLDKRSWVCSLNLNTIGAYPPFYFRHFFIPYDWFAGQKALMCAIAKRDIIFARNKDIVTITGGLDFGDKVGF